MLVRQGLEAGFRPAHRIVFFRGISLYPLTLVGGDRERLLGTSGGRGKTVCARGAWGARLGRPSTSPLGCLLTEQGH